MKRRIGALLRGIRNGWRRELGMVTAELALTIPAVVLVLTLVVSVAVAGITQLRVADAARAAARQAAIGETDISGAASRLAGEVAVSVERGELTCVTVSRPVPGPARLLGATARARNCAWTEPNQ